MTEATSTHEADGPPEETGPEVESYDDLLATLDVLEQEALRKVESGRVYDATNEKVRIKWIRITKDIVAEKRKVKAERDLEELAEQVEKLKEAKQP